MTDQQRIAEIEKRLSQELQRSGFSRRSVRLIEKDIPFLLSVLTAKDAEIDRLREAQRWIPVSERLPEEGQRVLVWNCASNPSHVATFTSGGRPENMWHYNDGYDDPACWVDGVTHWMPIPAESDHIPDATKMIGGA